jgi:hypothetical protein
MNFPAVSESYLNTRACGKTAQTLHFMRVFSIMEPEEPRKTRRLVFASDEKQQNRLQSPGFGLWV